MFHHHHQVTTTTTAAAKNTATTYLTASSRHHQTQQHQHHHQYQRPSLVSVSRTTTTASDSGSGVWSTMDADITAEYHPHPHHHHHRHQHASSGGAMVVALSDEVRLASGSMESYSCSLRRLHDLLSKALGRPLPHPIHINPVTEFDVYFQRNMAKIASPGRGAASPARHRRSYSTGALVKDCTTHRDGTSSSTVRRRQTTLTTTTSDTTTTATSATRHRQHVDDAQRATTTLRGRDSTTRRRPQSYSRAEDHLRSAGVQTGASEASPMCRETGTSMSFRQHHDQWQQTAVTGKDDRNDDIEDAGQVGSSGVSRRRMSSTTLQSLVDRRISVSGLSRPAASTSAGQPLPAGTMDDAAGVLAGNKDEGHIVDSFAFGPGCPPPTEWTTTTLPQAPAQPRGRTGSIITEEMMMMLDDDDNDRTDLDGGDGDQEAAVRNPSFASTLANVPHVSNMRKPLPSDAEGKPPVSPSSKSMKRITYGDDVVVSGEPLERQPSGSDVVSPSGVASYAGDMVVSVGTGSDDAGSSVHPTARASNHGTQQDNSTHSSGGSSQQYQHDDRGNNSSDGSDNDGLADDNDVESPKSQSLRIPRSDPSDQWWGVDKEDDAAKSLPTQQQQPSNRPRVSRKPMPRPRLSSTTEGINLEPVVKSKAPPQTPSSATPSAGAGSQIASGSKPPKSAPTASPAKKASGVPAPATRSKQHPPANRTAPTRANTLPSPERSGSNPNANRPRRMSAPGRPLGRRVPLNRSKSLTTVRELEEMHLTPPQSAQEHDDSDHHDDGDEDYSGIRQPDYDSNDEYIYDDEAPYEDEEGEEEVGESFADDDDDDGGDHAGDNDIGESVVPSTERGTAASQHYVPSSLPSDIPTTSTNAKTDVKPGKEPYQAASQPPHPSQKQQQAQQPQGLGGRIVGTSPSSSESDQGVRKSLLTSLRAAKKQQAQQQQQRPRPHDTLTPSGYATRASGHHSHHHPTGGAPSGAHRRSASAVPRGPNDDLARLCETMKEQLRVLEHAATDLDVSLQAAAKRSKMCERQAAEYRRAETKLTAHERRCSMDIMCRLKRLQMLGQDSMTCCGRPKTKPRIVK
eukprot:PhM_4_TR8316/c0_g1_i1/m.77688